MNDKKILLINPPSPSFVKYKSKNLPLSLLYLSSTLKENNHESKIIDLDNSSENFENKLNSFDPDIIGITCLFSGRFKPTIDLSKEIKKYSTAPIVIGGLHPTIFPKEILNEYSSIDYICLGEGEKSLVELIDAHFNDDNKDKLKSVDGIVYRNDDEIVINKKTSFIENLDLLPFPDFEAIDLKNYYLDTSKWHNPKNLPIDVPMPIVSSRSCPNRCTFCSMFLTHGKKWRMRSAKNVVDEIEKLYNEYGSRYFSFMDDNFTFSKKRSLEISNEIIGRGLNIQFDTPNGISIKTLDKEVMDNLVCAGLVRTCVAPESGSEYIRNTVMKKRVSTEKIYEFFDLAKNYKDLQVKAFFIVGYPQETHETLNDTYKMIARISDSVDQISVFNVIPFPGTELFDYCAKNNLIDVPLDNLHNLAEFANYNESDRAFIKPHKLEIEDLYKFREKAYKLIKQEKITHE